MSDDRKRLKYVRIDVKTFLLLMREGMTLAVKSGLPLDAKIEQFAFDARDGAIHAKVSSETFDPVREGERLPELEIGLEVNALL